MLVQDLVVWRTKFQDRPVQVPRIRRRKDPHIASPSGVLFPVQETEIQTFEQQWGRDGRGVSYLAFLIILESSCEREFEVAASRMAANLRVSIETARLERRALVASSC